jgi:hypothetical protein
MLAIAIAAIVVALLGSVAIEEVRHGRRSGPHDR